MNEFKKYIILMLIKSILYIISIIGCLLFILLYIYLIYRIKKKKAEQLNSKNIGLGTNYMLMLIFSNIGGAMSEIFLFCQVKEKNNNISDSLCCTIGFLRNYFELCSVSCISMITFLFYKSTTPKNLNPKKDILHLFIGIFYSFILPLLFTLPPYFYNKFDYVGPKCSFTKEITIYGVLFTIYIIINGLLQIFALYKSFIFYHHKLKLLKEQNIDEYNLLKIYVWIFLFFPIYLILSRSIKFISRLDSEVFLFIGECIFSLSGFFDSFICIFFLRGIIPCCKKKESRLIENIKETPSKI